jgi:hypothetical protein
MYSRTPSAARIFGTRSRLTFSILILLVSGYPLALPGIVGRKRASGERHHCAAIPRRAGFNPEDHVLADIRDDARWLRERGLPDLQRIEDARTRRTCRNSLLHRFVTCRHD